MQKTYYTNVVQPSGLIFENVNKNITNSISWNTTVWNFKYSFDGVNWNEIDSTLIQNDLYTVNFNDRIYIKSAENTTYIFSESTPNTLIFTQPYNIIGNILYIVSPNKDFQAVKLRSLDKLFKDSPVVDASELDLVSMEEENTGGTVSNYKVATFRSLFENCTLLVNAPSLDFTKSTYKGAIPDEGFLKMFKGCTSLITAPVLPKNKSDRSMINHSSCQEMFSGCTSLVNIPEIDAALVDEEGCRGMFKNCTSLTTTPIIDVNYQSNTGAFREMFKGCTSLVNISSINVVLSGTPNYRYNSMFEGCSSLIIPPSLSTMRCRGTYAYGAMFKNCINLEKLPRLQNLNSDYSTNTCAEMFYGCSKIKVSAKQTGEYTSAYQVPKVSGGASGMSTQFFMFKNTGGSFTSDYVSAAATYYTSNEIIE